MSHVRATFTEMLNQHNGLILIRRHAQIAFKNGFRFFPAKLPLWPTPTETPLSGTTLAMRPTPRTRSVLIVAQFHDHGDDDAGVVTGEFISAERP